MHILHIERKKLFEKCIYKGFSFEACTFLLVTLRNVKRVILQIAYVVGGIKVVRQN